MRIGVVCEGHTDFIAIKKFIGALLASDGIECEFISLQPNVDETRKNAGGWSLILSWLERHSLEDRRSLFFQGLFAENMSDKVVDIIIIQMDADIVEDHAFISRTDYDKYVNDVDVNTGTGRHGIVGGVLKKYAELVDQPQGELDRHIVMPAVDSTEAWCVAAYNAKVDDIESLRGSDLSTAFMRALEVSEGRGAKDSYAVPDKSFNRRLAFCESYAQHSRRILKSCTMFSKDYGDMISSIKRLGFLK